MSVSIEKPTTTRGSDDSLTETAANPDFLVKVEITTAFRFLDRLASLFVLSLLFEKREEG